MVIDKIYVLMGPDDLIKEVENSTPNKVAGREEQITTCREFYKVLTYVLLIVCVSVILLFIFDIGRNFMSGWLCVSGALLLFSAWRFRVYRLLSDKELFFNYALFDKYDKYSPELFKNIAGSLSVMPEGLIIPSNGIALLRDIAVAKGDFDVTLNDANTAHCSACNHYYPGLIVHSDKPNSLCIASYGIIVSDCAKEPSLCHVLIEREGNSYVWKKGVYYDD